MEWIIGITVVCLILYLMGAGGSEATSTKKSKAPAVKNFIDEERIYTEEDAVYTIQQFILALGDTEDFNHTSRADDIAQSFPRLLEKLRKEYQHEIKSWEEEATTAEEHCKSQIDDVQSDPDLDKEEKKEEIADLKRDLKEELKQPKRAIKFCEKQISGINENPKQILKKTLTFMKNEHKDDNPLLNLDDDLLVHDLIKEVPL